MHAFRDIGDKSILFTLRARGGGAYDIFRIKSFTKAWMDECMNMYQVCLFVRTLIISLRLLFIIHNSY